LAEKSFLQKRAQEMRREPTEAEKRLWRYLSKSQLGGYKFRRQKVRKKRIFDFFCPAKGLIVEVDGHTHDRENDVRQDALLCVESGFGILRVTNVDVMTNMDGVLAYIFDALTKRSDRWPGKANHDL
jgi:very-short-patch-repair endonuclease